MSVLSKTLLRVGAAAAALVVVAPGAANACACGCGVFDVGTSSLFPSSAGGTAFIEFGALDQSKNWSGDSSAPASGNDDKDIDTKFYTVGAQYMIDRNWGVTATVPIWDRTITMDDGMGPMTVRHTALGDMRVTARYTGFSPNMSSGVTVGLKLPTGDWRFKGIEDRDMQIGTGSTDLLVGAYHMGYIGKTHWAYFAEGQAQQPLLIQGGYRPGADVNGAVGVYPQGKQFGPVKVTPVLKLIGSAHARDGGPEGDPQNTGYVRALAAPGLEVEAKGVRLYADVELPVYQHVNGQQLVAPVQFKLVLSHAF
jgi:hypothetical protein